MHWTYRSSGGGNSALQQGDIIILTEDLRNVLNRNHPSLDLTTCNGLLVLTQSCDLVRRGIGRTRRCRASHIVLARIESLRYSLVAILDQKCKPIQSGLYPEEEKRSAEQLLERLLNQTEHDLGLFYIHPDKNIEIVEESVALLRQTITLDIEHEKLLKKARRGRLTYQFQSKLGWLVGYLYSRIGTVDWIQTKERKKQHKKLVRRLIKTDDQQWDPVWINHNLLSAAIKQGIVFDGRASKDRILELLKTVSPICAIDRALDRMDRVIEDTFPNRLSPAERELLKSTLRDDESFKSQVRR